MVKMTFDKALTGMDIFHMMTSYQQSQIVCTTCSLGIFDVIHKSTIPVTSDAVANQIQTNPDATERLLNTCVGHGLLEISMDANGIATYNNTPATSKYLVSTSAMSMKPMCMMQIDLYKLWGRLPVAVTNGASQLPLVTGSPGAMFDKGSGFHVDEKMKYSFLQCMHMLSRMDSPHVLDAFNLGEYDRICDLGGGTGALAADIASKYPECHVTVMELPHVIGTAKRFLPKSKPNNLSFVAGDFFQESLPEADLYILSHVIHDWERAKINTLLSKIHASLGNGGAVLLCEKMLRPLKTGPQTTLLFDMGLMLVSEGRERTEEEYQTLLIGNGFTDIQTKELPEMCFRDVIFAKKFS